MKIWFLIALLAGTALAGGDERSDCQVQADYARYVADERDRGVPMKEVMARVSGTDPEKVWARMTVGNIYGNRLVTAQRVEELYLVRCEP